MIRSGEKGNEIPECICRCLSGLDSFAPFEKRRRVDPAKRQPTFDVLQRDVQILRMRGDLSGDPLPTEGAILPLEVVIVAGWIIENHFDEAIPIIVELPGQMRERWDGLGK
ncbi:MAG: hypothetical protein CFE44_10325 [Burkholderiales bacterium PBB4]|nr:MAG: hypothetical protein CFE44_10325 [Burkholderiales bacterium PBB4]